MEKQEVTHAGIGNATNIINCYNSGTVECQGWSFGIGNATKLINSYNKGEIKGTTVVGIGGGVKTANYSNCFNSGKLSGSTAKKPITASSNTPITNCYYLSSEVSEEYSNIDSVSIPMTAAQMKASSFVTTLNNNLSSMEKINNIDFYQWKYVANSYPEFNK